MTENASRPSVASIVAWPCNWITRRADRRWTEHILGASDGSNRNTVVNFCSRLEFQDGKRKRGTQKYHGSGRVHSHSLDFLENLDAVQLHTKLAATIPEAATDPMLRGIVLDSQKDWTRSGVPLREEPSAWDADRGLALLHHSEDDHDAHIRAYFPETMEVTKCHEDVQQADGNSALLRYVATYQQKFSSSFAKEWLNDEASDYSLARRILFDHHPLEPEMWLTLFAQKFPQCVMGGTMVDMVAPVPGSDTKTEIVESYEKCAWRRADMCLLEFLRKSNADGQIIRWLRNKHEHSGEECTLEEFANMYKTRGEKLMAISFVSRMRDEFYGQWMAMHVPFKNLDKLLDPSIVEKVPPHLKYFACAMQCAEEHWSDETGLRQELALEGHGNEHTETVINFVKAQRHLVRRYLSGDLAADEVHDVDLETDEEEAAKPGAERLRLDPAQRKLKQLVDRRVALAMEAREAPDDETYEEILIQAGRSEIIIALGPPGSGKTTVIHKCVRKWHRKGARILFALPTGQLASEIRRVHTEIDVDTCHGALLFHKDLTEALPILTQYDLVVIDELSMLTADHYDRVHAMWQTAEKLPCVVMLGDFYQLPGPQKPPSRISDSPAYRYAKKMDFSTVHRCKDPKLAKKLKALRTSVPSMRLLKKIVNTKHRAWKSEEPTTYDVLTLLRRHDNTVMVTCTRKAAMLLNDLTITVLFEHRHKEPLAVLPGDWETDPNNFGADHNVPKGARVEPVQVKIFEGMRLFLTQNLNKRNDFVNGMSVTVESYHEESGCLQVMTKTGKMLAIPCIREKVEGHYIDYFPIRVGYASTIQKLQGQTLDHVTIWLDRPGCKAAGYVAMARVRTDADYLIAGKVTPWHFVPAM